MFGVLGGVCGLIDFLLCGMLYCLMCYVLLPLLHGCCGLFCLAVCFVWCVVGFAFGCFPDVCSLGFWIG